MSDQKPMLVYAATYSSVSAAEADLDAIVACQSVADLRQFPHRNASRRRSW